MKKRLLAVLSAAAICLSAIPVTVNAEEIIPPDRAEEVAMPDWIPNTFDAAEKFYDTYGNVHIEDNLLCIIYKENTANNREYYIASDQITDLTVIIPISELFHATFSENDSQFQYEVVVFNPPESIDFKVVLGYYSDNIPNYDARYSFSVDENGAITESDYWGQYKSIKGDVNDDGTFNVSDVVLLQKWLLAVPDTHLANWKAANFCDDDRLNVFDLCLMKRALIEQHQQRQITVDDIVSLSKKGDDLTVADFASFKGEDIGSGLCVMKYEVTGKENQYYLLVGHDGTSEKPVYAKLVNIQNDGKWDEIDIRSEEFQNAVEIYENWNKGTDTEENRASARTLGDYALEKLKDGTYSLDTVIDSENASELMDEETAALMDKYVFTDMEFLDEHTVMLHLSYGLFADCGYLITDGTVAYESDTQVSVPYKGYDGDVINIEWADGNLYYFTAGL